MQRAISATLFRHNELLQTIRIYNKIVNMHIAAAIQSKTFSKQKLHHLAYAAIRTQYPNFPSALIQNARDNAVEMLKGNKLQKSTIKNASGAIRFDLRTAKVFLDSGVVKFTTIQGRRSYKLNIPFYFSKYFSLRVKAITLSIDRNHLKLKIIVAGEVQKCPHTDRVVGIDLGIKNFAVLSNDTFVKPNKINRIRRKYAYLRRQLQSKGTRSARRHLHLLSGRERRFMRDFNHCLSKRIAEMDYGTFALENLKCLRTGKKGKKFNRMRHNWSYFQLRQFLIYKAENLGKNVVLIDPKHTSQKCSSCDYVSKDNRNKGLFHCKSCGYRDSADLNASKNISSLGSISLGRQAAVNQPIVASVSA